MIGDADTVDDQAIFRSIVMESPIPIALLVGRDFIITIANEPQLAVWGKGNNVMGMPLARAIPEMEGQPFLSILDGVFTTGITFASNSTPANMLIDGILKTVYFDFSFKAMRDQQGDIYGIIATGIEITQQIIDRHALQRSEERFRQLSVNLDKKVQERTQQYQDSIQELKRSNENLQQFAFIASHDLQEPLRKVQQFGGLLRSQYSHLLGEGVSYIERMQSAASRMSLLIRDLLSYSRIATQLETNVPVSLTAIVQTVVRELRMVISETDATIQVSNLPIVKGDPPQLEQLFFQLLSNALKFRKIGNRPHITIQAKEVVADMLPKGVRSAQRTFAYHQIDVTDNGIGFDEKYLDRIFAIFQRLNDHRSFSGTGIGLAICEKVVTNHRGAISAISTPGVGTTFRVFLPLHSISPGAQQGGDDSH